MSIPVKIQRLSRQANGTVEPDTSSETFELEVDTSHLRGRLSFQAQGRWSEILSRAVSGGANVRVTWCDRSRSFRVGSVREREGRTWVEFVPLERSDDD
jgi:hypothetical protein